MIVAKIRVVSKRDVSTVIEVNRLASVTQFLPLL